MALEIKILRGGDEHILDNVADGVFDGSIDDALRSEFLRDPRHHLSVAIESGIVVGFASAVHYVHPDKPPQLWINEVGVAPSHQRKGIAKGVLSTLMSVGRELGCTEAWVLTDEGNAAARALYQSAGGAETPHVMVSFPLASRSNPNLIQTIQVFGRFRAGQPQLKRLLVLGLVVRRRLGSGLGRAAIEPVDRTGVGRGRQGAPPWLARRACRAPTPCCASRRRTTCGLAAAGGAAARSTARARRCPRRKARSTASAGTPAAATAMAADARGWRRSQSLSAVPNDALMRVSMTSTE